MNTIAQCIIDEIQPFADAGKAQWQENYVKHNTRAYGVGIPIIRKIVKKAEKEYTISRLPDETQIAILDSLMKHNYTEPKLAAILYMQLFWKQDFPTRTLNVISNWFDQHWIFDWNICDWLCVRVLSPLVDKQQERTIPALTSWQNDSYLWKARAALVPFAQCKTLEKHKNLILCISTTLIQREERFCKTAVGWVLRQFSKVDSGIVIQFLADHQSFLTKEVEKNATKYLK